MVYTAERSTNGKPASASVSSSTALQAEPSQLEVHVDQDQHRGTTTPIATLYLREINRTRPQDKLIILQKSLTQPEIVAALVRAKLRGVEVSAVYRDHLSPECERMRAQAQSLNCGQIFQKSRHPHHKSMMVLQPNGTVRAIIGSYNTRNQKAQEKRPRMHTVLFMEIPAARALFDFYHAESKRLLPPPVQAPKTQPVQAPKTLTLRSRRGLMQFILHPQSANPVLQLLNTIRPSRDTRLWLSYYTALPETTFGLPVFEKLRGLQALGCQVRVLLDKNCANLPAFEKLCALRIPVRLARFPTGTATLGHKLVLVKNAQEVLVLQSSANLSHSHHRQKHNLTLCLRGRGFLPIHQKLEHEVARYWRT